MRYHATNPLQVEFARGLISSHLKHYAAEIAAAWDQAHRADDLTSDEAEHDLCPHQTDVDDPAPDEGARRGSIETPTVRHKRLPTDPAKEPYWVTSPAVAVYGMRPELIPSTDPARLRGAECRANAAQILQRLEYRCAHLWPIVLDAVVHRKKMADIGKAFGGNSQSAAAIGRAMVVAGLEFCRMVLDDIARESGPALGGTFYSLPKWVQHAENDNRRAVRPMPKLNGRKPCSRAEMAKAAAVYPCTKTA